jgi:hypothetical protein
MKKSLSLIAATVIFQIGCPSENKSGPANPVPAEKPSAAKPASAPASAASQPAAKAAPAKTAHVFFRAPMNQAKVLPTFSVGFGVNGMGISPAGEAIEDKTKGHHHLIINGKSIPKGQVVPMDDTHKHFGKGQTEATLTLPVGKHTLTMQFADGAHISYGEALSKTIQVEVVEGGEERKVFFITPTDKAKVKSPVSVQFGVKGMTVRPAGEDPLDHTSGHHHLIIDGEAPAFGVPVAKDATHIHYGKGQTETTVELAPGKHTLTMQLADGAHLSYGPAMRSQIEIEVVP